MGWKAFIGTPLSSVGSESSFQTEPSPRRKSASPRRRYRLAIPSTPSSSSDSAGEQFVSSSSSNEARSSSGERAGRARAPLVSGMRKNVQEACKDSGQSSGGIETGESEAEKMQTSCQGLPQDGYSSGDCSLYYRLFWKSSKYKTVFLQCFSDLGVNLMS